VALPVRLDVALHALRLFKSRSQAQDAIAAGQVPRDNIEFTLELTTGAVIKIEHGQ